MAYSEKVVQYFMNPVNVGELPDPDGVGEVGNPKCGDVMKIYLRIRDGKIEDVRFQTFGCAAAIATSSMVTEMVKGKTIDEALNVTNKDVAEALGGLPPEKVHCSLLAEQGIRAAIEDYLRRQRGESPEPTGGSCFSHHEDEEGMESRAAD
ncbi:Fe-S cluster assembly scaffold protein NifU [Thermanaerovibrio acidaminovorans]|jgi:nitrogen fixation NifU-like protein|uniref:FeS cluster assembly scaffold protein NifU n=1 Tax=Thermanaerovibrio acidaminovorans (strain ATCC 49978 / DSM 6589 / Su883) TaxID=525903 RepID=D1B842_THEAS|nr:Fe-S cluster assembly scaffold protein NifU [Thermanaerovibrio acidaminovorans]ACZ18445.1 FeS cluster assembly scaffold protein NifU [Thermanaerovibrio acidaminovorans DSM 6589]